MEFFLAQTTPGSAQKRFALATSAPTVIGRDPACDVTLVSDLYAGVSRRHAEIVRLAGGAWQITDLQSSNGTFVNGDRVTQSVIKDGDTIALGTGAATFAFGQQATAPAAQARAGSEPFARPGGNVTPPRERRFISEVAPIFSRDRGKFLKEYAAPGVFICLATTMIFIDLDKSDFNGVRIWLGLTIIGATVFLVARMCGRMKPWWVEVGAGVFTVLVLMSPVYAAFDFFFQHVLPGSVPDGRSPGVGSLLQLFFGVGLKEELVKALPILLAVYLGMKLKSPWRERLGVFGPIDGILIGAASAAGFTFLETLGQYVPNAILEQSQQYGPGAGQLVGLVLEIGRMLGSISGHVAWSGYFGYIIGLALTRPAQRWQIFVAGWVVCGGLHAIFDAVVGANVVLGGAIGVVSYLLLIAAIGRAKRVTERPSIPSPFVVTP